MIHAAILTISDSATAGTRADTSGPALAARITELGWTVAATGLVPDDPAAIAATLCEWSDAGHGLILTTGGTGLSERDVTPEATRTVIEREIPGIAEWIRARGMEQTKMSILSRGLAGQRKRSHAAAVQWFEQGVCADRLTGESEFPEKHVWTARGA